MNQRKFDQLMRKQTGVCKKIFGTVPISEPWSVPQINAEVRRQNISSDLNIVKGCLNSLKNDGLVKEPRAGHFIRTEPKQAVKLHSFDELMQEIPTMTGKTAEAARVKTPLEKLFDLAEALERTAKDFQVAVLETEDYLNSQNAEMGKLQQLKQLLKDI